MGYLLCPLLAPSREDFSGVKNIATGRADGMLYAFFEVGHGDLVLSVRFGPIFGYFLGGDLPSQVIFLPIARFKHFHSTFIT